MKRTACLHLHADALRANLRCALNRVPGSKAWAVIKAEAYGHGMVWAAHTLRGVADGFAVSCVAEAMVLREQGIEEPILVLQGPLQPDDWEQCVRFQLQAVLHDASQLRSLDRWWKGRLMLKQKPLPGLWLKLDTGMHRLGFPPESARDLMQRLASHPVAGNGLHWLSHLACADEPEHPLNTAQLKAFTAAVQGLDGLRSMANSAAILSGLTLPLGPTQWLRPGIMLYGADPLGTLGASSNQMASLGETGDHGHIPWAGTDVTEKSDSTTPVVTTGSGLSQATSNVLQPVMTVTAPIIAVKTIVPGDSVGYGATWTATAPTRIGIVAMGYADGYPRHAPSGTPVLIQGQLCPLVGRVSMDMLAVDLSQVPTADVGTIATLWGQGLPVTRIAAAAGTISYELLTRVADRLRIVG